MSKFSEMLYNFIKGSATEAPQSVEEKPQIEETKKETSGDEIYDQLNKAIENGEVQPTKDGIISWASAKGLSNEQANELASLADGISGEDTESNMDEEMAKGILSFLNEMKEGYKKLSEENTLLKSQLADLTKETTGIKESILELGNTNVEKKSPAISTENIPSGKTRPEMLEMISKGIIAKDLTREDLYTYETTNRITKNVKNYMEKVGR